MCLHKLFDKHLGKELLGKKSIFIFFTAKMKAIFGEGKRSHVSLYFWTDSV